MISKVLEVNTSIEFELFCGFVPDHVYASSLSAGCFNGLYNQGNFVLIQKLYSQKAKKAFWLSKLTRRHPTAPHCTAPHPYRYLKLKPLLELESPNFDPMPQLAQITESQRTKIINLPPNLDWRPVTAHKVKSNC